MIVDVQALAYPVGYPLGRASPLRSALERAGYEVGFTNGTGRRHSTAR